jgi:hypothetical protein
VSAPAEMPEITGNMSTEGVARALGAAGIYVFPVDHPGLNLCAGIGKGHDPFSPNHPRGKHPTIPWGDKATAKDGVISAHFYGQQRNIGIHCGKSGLLVIDEDELGELDRFAADHGVQIPETSTTTTADGKHYYFADTEGGALGNKEGAFGSYKINIRSGNGYVVAPGSVHETGVVYTLNGVRTIAPLPAWIPDAIRNPKQSSSSTSSSDGTPTSADLFSGGFKLPDVIHHPHRHNTLIQYAGSLRGRGIPLDEARDLIIHRALPRCKQPPEAPYAVTEADAIAKLEDVYQRYPEGRSAAASAPPPHPPTAHDLILPPSFYASTRPTLFRMHACAHSRGVAADMVLYSNLARISGMLPTQCRLVTGYGSDRGASLNLFVAAIGASGDGKSTGSSLSRSMYAAPPMLDFLDGVPLGSGEGIAEAYMGWVWHDIPNTEVKSGQRKGLPQREKVREQVRRNAFYFADEGQMFTKLQERSGSTLSEVIRTAWYGGTLGNTNADSERTRIILEGEYSMGMFIGFQPETARPLLKDFATGTTQRFLYCSTIDPGIPESRPTRIPIQPTVFQPEPRNVQLPDEIADQVWRHHNEKRRGVIDVPRLDAHGMLTRLKLAALLALLDGRYVVTTSPSDGTGDWELAEVMWRTSCAVRDHYIAEAERQATRDRRDRNLSYADREGMAEARRQQVRDASTKVQRVAALVAKYAHAPVKPSGTIGDVSRRLRSDSRACLGEALLYAITEGWVEVDGDKVTPGPSRPA